MKKELIIFTDSGDTIVDEGTEIRDENGIVTHADLIPFAGEVLKKLYDEGYSIIMVADGEEQSFTNVYKEHALDHCFASRTISELVGVQKPDRKMFDDAMAKNRLTEEDKCRIVMIGNNIKKDIAGANRYGITSILLDWSPRYEMNPSNQDETADYIVHTPKELLKLIHSLNEKLLTEHE